MSKPWYYTIGYPVKVLHYGSWYNAIICDGYRYEDGIITTMVEDGETEWLYEDQKEHCLKPNPPDDNPWITTPPKSSEWAKVYMTVMPYNAPIVIRGSIEGGKFYHANGRHVKERVTAWKYIRYPEPYKEVSEE